MAKQLQILCWRNKFSGEEGFVKTVSRKKGYFESTYDKSEARSYLTPSLAEKDIEYLGQIGETNNNDFFIATK